MKPINIEIEDAYMAIFDYLESSYQMTNSSDLGGLLGGLQLDSDGVPFDTAAWNDWINAVSKATGKDFGNLKYKR